MLKFRYDEINIVIGVEADSPEHTAANSICDRFVKEAGVDVKIVVENEAHLFKKKFIVVSTPDTCNMLRKIKKPKHDGYLIDVQKEKIILLGGVPRGTLYAVDQFLSSIKMEADCFTIEEGSMLEEPSFKTRIFQDYGIWGTPFRPEELKIIKRCRFNSFIFGQNVSNGVLLKESFPEIYNLMKNREDAEKCNRKELDIDKRFKEIRNKYGIDNYTYLALGIPKHLREAVYETYPNIKGVSRPNSYESAHICPSNPISWEIWRAIVKEVVQIHSSAEGIYLDIMHNGYGIYCQCDRCRATGINEFPAELRKAVLETYKVLKEHGKKLLYHTWSTNSKPRKGRSQGSDSGIPWRVPGDKPEWLFRQVIEWTPPEVELVKMDTWGDVQPTAPMDPLIGKVGKHPQIIQFQISGEYRGFNKVPSSMVQYLKDRMGACARLGVSGVLVIAGGWIDPFYIFWEDIINSVNFEAFAKFSWDVEESAEDVWSSWAEKVYGKKAAPHVITALKMSQSVIEKSLGIRGLNFTDHSGYPTSIPRMWEITWDWSNYWYPDSNERFAITPENIKEVIGEKEEALKTAREMLSIIKEAECHLQKKQYSELNERIEWLIHYATIQRYLAEIYFRMLFLEEQSKKGKIDAGQIEQIELACTRVAEAHSKLPKSAKKESYYIKLPEKETLRTYPAYPWLPAHTAGHPVKLANMLKEHAFSIFYLYKIWKKVN